MNYKKLKKLLTEKRITDLEKTGAKNANELFEILKNSSESDIIKICDDICFNNVKKFYSFEIAEIYIKSLISSGAEHPDSIKEELIEHELISLYYSN